MAHGTKGGTVLAMKKTLIAVSLLSVAMLTACGTQNPTTSAKKVSETGVIDTAVAALLPQGEFTVTGEFSNSDGPVTTIDGYVKYGTDPNGKDCESEYIMTKTGPDAPTEFVPTKVRTVRTAGALSWYQDISNPTKPGEWRDHADMGAPGVVMLFGPTLVADDWGVGAVEGAGNGQLCAIPLMARIMKLENGELTYDIKRAEATIKARWDRWAERYIDAVGVTGVERTIAVDLLKETGLPSFRSIMESTKMIKVTKNADDSYEITQTQPSGIISVRLLFKPSTERAIEPVAGKSSFDRVAEEVKNSGLTPSEFLNKE